MKKIMMLLLCCVIVAGCTDKKTATKALKSQGYTEIEITGHKFFACSEADFYSTGFRAKSVNGTQVTGVVCSGFLFKSSTTRLF